MCGIAGLLGPAPVADEDRLIAGRMLRTLAHRGPDDEHIVVDDRAILGVRRLAILDLEGGRQPLSGDDEAVTVACNGEIYNFIELRRELAGRGHQIRSTGDTEVIAHAYEEWGVDLVPRLHGMFAIAIWDRHRQRLVLARDRLGKKPLYWAMADGDLIWGSELKALLEHPAAHREIDHESLALYLRYQYVPAPRSIFTGIHKLEPASILVRDGSAAPIVSRYWEPRFEPKHDLSLESAAQELRPLLDSSVAYRLRSDVPIGVFLSGGVDSGLVTALASRLSATPLRTYSIGFEERDLNELPGARAIARAFGTIHTEDVVHLDALSALPALTEEFDEPFGDSSALPTMRVAQLASADVKVVLTGDGGDESFGGYRRYAAMSTVATIARVPRPLRRLGRASTTRVARRLLGDRALTRRLARGWDAVDQDPSRRYLSLMSIFDTPDIVAMTGHDGTPAYLESALDQGLDPVERLLRADLTTYLPEDLLVKMDRATMAHGVEARSPLLDHRIVEFAAALPSRLKVRNRKGKVLLRSVADAMLPPGHVDRPKQGFAVPLESWFDDDLGTYLADVLHDPSSVQLLDPGVGRRLLAEHRAGRGRHGPRLWALLTLELWARRWSRARIGAAA